MKLVQAMKQIKMIKKQIDDLKGKISLYSADEDDQNPVYGSVETQTAQIAAWEQSIHDLVKEIERLEHCKHKTNLLTNVMIQIDDVAVTKPIDSWITRRQTLADLEKTAWSCLRENTGRIETRVVKKTGGDEVIVKFRRYFDPKQRDAKMRIYTMEPTLIDGALEVANAETDLIES